MGVEFVVITRVPAPESGGNLASTIGLAYVDPQAFGEGASARHRSLLEVAPALALFLQVPVFTLGEILVCDADGRELVGAGRKPAKWDVGYEAFATVEAAIARALEVTS